MDVTNIVVCLGYDAFLLESRRKVLATRFAAHSAGSLQALGQLIKSTGVEVLVICHTIPHNDCLAAMLMARSSAKTIDTLLLTLGQPVPLGLGDTVPMNVGPGMLLAKLSELIKERSARNEADCQPTRLAPPRPEALLALESTTAVLTNRTRKFHLQIR